MRIDEYLSRYEKYRRTYNNLKKARIAYEFCDTKLNGMFVINRYDIMGVEALDREIARRERVLRYANARMQAAISRMESIPQANYIMCKYFYGMKNTEISETFSYCERHVYRLSAAAKKSLYRELVKLMPNPRRGDVGKVYRFSNTTKKQAV